MLPLLLVFGAFSWYPIVRTAVMAFQHTNLVQAPTWVGLAELRRRHPRPADADRRQEHRLLRAARARVRLSDPSRRGGAHERGAKATWALQRARIPAGRHPAGRRRAPVEDVLRRKPDGRVQHDPRLGRPRAVPVAAVAALGDAVTRARVDVGERRRHGDHLPRRAHRRELGSVRGRRGGRREPAAEGVARDVAAAARRAARDDDPADHRDRAGVPRAVSVHVGRAGERDADRAASRSTTTRSATRSAAITARRRRSA